ncbi:quinone oxidoreductase-like [Uloborus diversus]|uniref:quinone oxidoreductase-like n=1 Tax=Uloborus diversus TaxID=327109 RepID=UPI0024092CEA|nr:quinone oxidoreductase-like [Uloborus diversus]
MQAIRIAKFGSPSVLQLQTTAIPKVSCSKVLVKIKSAGVNPVDTYIREGKFLTLPSLPFTPGKDAAGVVHAVGENVSSIKVGQRVFMCGRTLGEYGTYAEYSLADAKDVFALGDKLTFDQGAALGVPYFTAYRALVLKARCATGELAFIHGASGAVGLASVQLAKSRGLKVIGTASTVEGQELVKSAGADFVVNHYEKNYLDKIMEISENKGVDIVVEMLANVNLDKDLDIIGARGRIVIVGSRGETVIDPRKMMGPEIQVTGVALMSSTEEEWKTTAESIVKGINQGWVNPIIDKRYPLEKAAEAHKDVMKKSGAKGKIVLTIEE